MLQVDERYRSYFHEFPPFYVHSEICQDDLVEPMQQQVLKEKIKLKQKNVLRTGFTYEGLILTSLLNFYLHMWPTAIKCFDIRYCLQFIKGYPFRQYIKDLTVQRIIADQDNLTSKSNMMKFLGRNLLISHATVTLLTFTLSLYRQLVIRKFSFQREQSQHCSQDHWRAGTAQRTLQPILSLSSNGGEQRRSSV
jgi:hypothetical protein